MTLEADLVAWVEQRPDWQQAVFARLCRRQPVDAATVTEIVNRLLKGESASAVSLTAADLPGAPLLAASTEFVALRDLAGVNALAPDQQLTFGAGGLTIVYGDNASGKSGYARVLKTAVGARVVDNILTDVFARTTPLAQAAVVDYRVAGVGVQQEWKLADSPDAQLQQAHFYDKANGDAYVSTESEISYRPSALVLLDQLIAVCDAVRTELDQRLQQCDANRPTLPTLPQGTNAARFVAGLCHTTNPVAIETACTAPDDSREQLGRLLSEEARLKASDPIKERDHLVDVANGLAELARTCTTLTVALSAAAIARLAEQRDKARQLRAAADVASSADFDAEPVRGVGSATWRALWEAAQAFSITEAYHDHEFPSTDDGSRCVLCHQELSPEAGDRLRRFQAYMTDTTEREAREAELELANNRTGLTQLDIPDAAAIAATVPDDQGLAGAIEAFLSGASAVRTGLLNWIHGEQDEPPQAVAPGPSTTLTEQSEQFREQAAAIDAPTFLQQLRHVGQQATELQASIALAEAKGDIEAEVARLAARHSIEEARRTTDTTHITGKASDLTRKYVTRDVRDQFTRESDRLRLAQITLDDTRGVKGKLLHRPALLGAARLAPVTQVFSEGEQTALGLAGFFTEVVFDTTKSAVVLDDPITSLDHSRRSLVAQRLVELAADRQVIVLTHEVSFVGDLVRHASEARVAVTERWVQRNGDLLGVCADKHPWKAKDVKARIGVLEHDLAEIKRQRNSWDQEQYEDHCAEWGGKLSEAWERAVNLEIVNEVVDRGTSQVRPRMFRIFAAITQQDDDDFQAGYGRCSEWARRHDKAPDINYVAPEPDEMEAELQRFRDWLGRIKGYRAS